MSKFQVSGFKFHPFAVALLSAAVVIPFLCVVREKSGQFALEVRLASSASGHVQVYYDSGSGFSEKDSTAIPLHQGAALETYRLALPPGTYGALRFDPIDRDGTVTIASARIVGVGGGHGRDLPLSAFKPLHQIESMRTVDGRLEVDVVPGAGDPQLLLEFSPPLALKITWMRVLIDWGWRTACVFATLLALYGLLNGSCFVFCCGSNKRSMTPYRAVFFVSALAVVASAYPIVFLGKSYVSPNLGTVLLYDGFPTLPGYADEQMADIKGSDIGSIMWAIVPYSMAQNRALLRDGELPLWNRWNSCGTPLLGQGFSMFGDPLHLLPVIAKGAAWAWDLRYLLSKWLFAAGLGLLVLAVTRHAPAALIVSLAAPFVGFFLYRLNHPALFGVCYAPWPLYCWVRLTQAGRPRAIFGWCAGMMLANLALMNSGSVKEAYMLLLTMNFSGACVLLAAAAPWRARLAKLAAAAGAGGLFVLITAPITVTFLDTMKAAYTAYNAPSAFQIQPGVMLGAFDEAFYRPLSAGAVVFNPSANFLILAGLLYFLATLRSQFGNRSVMALAASALVPLSFAFGLVPPGWIERTPFFANIAHIDNSFTCPLIVLWAVLAGAGFATAAARLRAREGRGDLAIAGLLLFALVFNYVAFGQAVHRSVFGAGVTFSPLKFGESIPLSPFILGYLAVLLAAVIGIGLISRHALARNRLSALQGAGLAVCAFAVLWRQGLQAEVVGFEDYVMRPTPRVDFHARSGAVQLLKAAQRIEPSRTVGLQSNFFPGWTGTYGLEGINGPDPLISPYYRELTGLSPLQRIWDWRLYLSRDNLAASRPFLDFLNVRHYLDLRSDQGALGAVLKLDQTGDLDVYESPTAWPRAFFTDRLAIYEKPGELMQRILHGDGRPFAAVQAFELAANPGLALIPRDLSGRAVVPADHYRLTENTTSFFIQAPGPGLVVLTEAWWPHYAHAEIDGRKAAVLRLNHAFEGLVIDTAGPHQVSVSYRARQFPLMLGLSAAGLAIMAGIFGIVAWVEKK